MADTTDVPYSPPQYIVSRSVLDREQLISEFESFKQSLHYVSRAPEVVFERLIGNINETILSRLSKQRAAQLAERRELEKSNEALKARVAGFEAITLREKDQHAGRLAELQELGKTNTALKEKVANLETITTRQETQCATQLTEFKELERSNTALKEKVEALENVERTNAELEEKVKTLENVEGMNAELKEIVRALEEKVEVLEAEMRPFRAARDFKDVQCPQS
ncbi:hypothetical protein P167DRAFT_546977 [Morchella conica CCBAS932]|uniref:Uncharacterized protein n=1 Tax=Morchella conica CCBAS932 TaxID=1392247 RepID=A0A3N4KY26_9PEZI|nr:hypothetical protein P167DRAFT_546977 [Morchella conica CCBAS932]